MTFFSATRWLLYLVYKLNEENRVAKSLLTLSSDLIGNHRVSISTQ